jgi:hypothetical protein
VTPSLSQKLALTVQFSPTAAGSVSGSISIVSNASRGPATVPLPEKLDVSGVHTLTAILFPDIIGRAEESHRDGTGRNLWIVLGRRTNEWC